MKVIKSGGQHIQNVPRGKQGQRGSYVGRAWRIKVGSGYLRGIWSPEKVLAGCCMREWPHTGELLWQSSWNQEISAQLHRASLLVSNGSFIFWSVFPCWGRSQVINWNSSTDSKGSKVIDCIFVSLSLSSYDEAKGHRNNFYFCPVLTHLCLCLTFPISY